MKKNQLILALFMMASFFLNPAFAQTGQTPATGSGNTSACVIGAYPKSSYFKVNGVPFKRLSGNVTQGATVEAFFTIAPGSPVATYSLVSYRAPAPTVTPTTSFPQEVYNYQTMQLGPGSHSLSITVPNCYFQVSFVRGCIIEKFGPAGTNNFYGAQNRLISSDAGGTLVCAGLEDDSPITPLGPGDSTECVVGAAPSSSYFKVNGVAHRRLAGNVTQGATVEAFFTIPAGSPVAAYTLVSYQAPGPTFNRSTANQQEVFDFETKQLGPGNHTLTVATPNCYFQVDFVMGCVIEELGPANSTNFYADQNRLLSSAVGGTQSCGTNSVGGGGGDEDSPIVPLGPGDSTECVVGTFPSSSYFKVNGVSHRRLHGNVYEGATVEAFFTIPAGSPVAAYTLVSYTAPGPTFDRNTAHLQEVFDFETKQLGPGNHTLTVAIPNCYFQVDFVMGCVIEELGPSNSNNFYRDQNRLISSAVGGTQSCGNNRIGATAVTPALNVFPNPVTEGTFKVAMVPSDKPTSLQIADLTGRTVYSSEIAADATEVNLNTKQLGMKPGLYIVNLKTADGLKTQKLMVK